MFPSEKFPLKPDIDMDILENLMHNERNYVVLYYSKECLFLRYLEKEKIHHNFYFKVMHVMEPVIL